jgi:hypothetical protein
MTFAKVSDLTCDRTIKTSDASGSCKIVKHGFLWKEEKEIPAKKLKGAKVIAGGMDKDNLTYKVVLVTNNEEIPFSPNSTFSDKNQYKEVSNQINKFARNPESNDLKISQDDRWWVIVGSISLIIGLYPLFKGKKKK